MLPSAVCRLTCSSPTSSVTRFARRTQVSSLVWCHDPVFLLISLTWYLSGDVGKLLGERWKALSDKQRAPYESKAAADKKRYEEEKAAYANVSVTCSRFVSPSIIWCPCQSCTSWIWYCYSCIRSCICTLPCKNPFQLTDSKTRAGRWWRWWGGVMDHGSWMMGDGKGLLMHFFLCHLSKVFLN